MARRVAFCMSVFDEDDANEWLGAEVEEGPGRALVCPPAVKALLILAFKDDAWTEDDTLDDDCKPADIDTWVAILKDASETHKTAVKSADIVRFKRWLSGHKVKDEDVDDVFSPSKQCLDDCAAQGAPTYRDLLFLDQSVYLGRPAGKSELVGAEYATPPGRSQGGTEARKGKLNTFDAELERCIDRGSAAGLDAFVLNLATLLSKHDHPFANGAAARINQWWMSLTQVMAKHRPDVKLAYIREYRTVYRGRGLPALYDGEIFARACGPEDAERATKEPQGDHYNALAAQMAELMKAQAGLAATVGTVAARLGALQSSLDGGPIRPSKLKCHYCGEEGHLKRDCPKLETERKAEGVSRPKA